ncbi:MAG: hypothetical protein WBG71_14555 [Leeuwenhoekiella sp.]
MKTFKKTFLLSFLLIVGTYVSAQDELPEVHLNESTEINDFVDYNTFLSSLAYLKIHSLKKTAKAKNLQLDFKQEDTRLSLDGIEYLKILKRKSNRNETFRAFIKDLKMDRPNLYKAIHADGNLKNIYRQFKEKGINYYLANLPGVL